MDALGEYLVKTQAEVAEKRRLSEQHRTEWHRLRDEADELEREMENRRRAQR